MRESKRQTIRYISSLMALIVFLISTGFTYHREACLHSSLEFSSSFAQDSSCCCQPIEEPCCCSEGGVNSCDLNYSSFVQFDFEAFFSSIDYLSFSFYPSKRNFSGSFFSADLLFKPRIIFTPSRFHQVLRRSQIQVFLL
jgi:hypothetical protein